MNILITGSSGYVGHNLSLTLVNQGFKVWGLDIVPPSFQHKNLHFVKYDFSSDAPLPEFKEKIDVLIHLVQSLHYKDFPNKSRDIFQVNEVSTFKLIEFALGNQIKHFIYTSTGSVYKSKSEALKEDDVCEADNLYEASKLNSENLLKQYQEFFKIDILRLFGVYGPGQKRMLIPTMIQKVKDGGQIELADNKGLIFNPLFIEDLTAAISQLINQPHSKNFEIFNIAGPQVSDLGEIVETISQLTNSKAELIITNKKPGSLIADIQKFQSHYPEVLCTDIKTGLYKTLSDE